jgi:DNA-binding MarR family transcriptional regulator
MRAWVGFLHAHAALRDRLHGELEAQCGLPLSWYDVLIQLHEQGGQARMQELARSILFSKSGLTRLIDRMERAGAVERRSCPEDGRGTLAVLTPEGRRLLARARPIHHRGIAEHFARHLSDEDVSTLVAVFERLIHEPGLKRQVPPVPTTA